MWKKTITHLFWIHYYTIFYIFHLLFFPVHICSTMTHQVNLHVPLGHPHSPAPTLGLAQLHEQLLQAAFLARTTSQIKKMPLNHYHHTKPPHQVSLGNTLICICRGREGKAGDRRDIWLPYFIYKRAPITLLGAPASSSGSLPKSSYVFSGRQRKLAVWKNSQLAIQNWEPIKGYRLIQNFKYTCYSMALIYFKLE